MQKPKHTLRYWRSLGVSLGLWLILAMPATAQVSACFILSQLSLIETGVFDLNDQNPEQLENTLHRLEISLADPANRPEVFAQITGDERWLDDFLRSRRQFLSLYIGGQYYQANNLKSSASFQSFGPALKKLNSAFFCSPSGPSQGSNSDGQIEEQRNTLAGESWLLRAMRKAKATVARLLANSSFVLAPLLVFLTLIIAIWLMIRFDERRRDRKRRFYCRIDITIHFSVAGQSAFRQGQITDISRSGTGLCVHGGLPVNATITIRSKDWQAKLTVMRCSGNQVGAAFQKPLKMIPDNFDLSAERKFIPRREYIKAVAPKDL